jgi:hypothetical protein
MPRPTEHLRLSSQHGCLVAVVNGSGGATSAEPGVLRVLPFPPYLNAAEDTATHHRAVTALELDVTGTLTFSCDTAGAILVHALVSRSAADVRPPPIPHPQQIRPSLCCMPAWLPGMDSRGVDDGARLTHGALSCAGG